MSDHADPHSRAEVLQENNRRLMTRGVIVAIVMVGLVALGSWYNAYNSGQSARRAAREAAAAAARNTEILHRLCVAINTVNAKQIVLWDHVLEVSPAPVDDAARQRTAAFRLFYETAFASQDCGPGP